MRRKILHRGLHYRRVTSGCNPREKAFADEWEKECQPIRGINLGGGILQDLMYCHDPNRPDDPSYAFGCHGHTAFRIRRRDAVIVATIVQWLGSNCGMSFLEMALKKCGYGLRRLDEAKVS
jgi:hypothetical protein